MPRPASSSTEKAAPAEVEAVVRSEKFEAVRPDGVTVVVVRNIDTGVQTVTEK